MSVFCRAEAVNENTVDVTKETQRLCHQLSVNEIVYAIPVFSVMIKSLHKLLIVKPYSAA